MNFIGNGRDAFRYKSAIFYTLPIASWFADFIGDDELAAYSLTGLKAALLFYSILKNCKHTLARLIPNLNFTYVVLIANNSNLLFQLISVHICVEFDT